MNKIKLFSFITLFALGTWGYLQASDSSLFTIQTQGEQLFIQSQQDLKIQLRTAQGQVILSSNLNANSQGNTLDLKNRIPVGTHILSASTLKKTQNYRISRSASGQIKLEEIKNERWIKALTTQAGIRDRIGLLADQQLHLAPDQSALLQQILRLLAHAHSQSKNSVLVQSQITLEKNLESWIEQLQSNNIHQKYMSEQLKLSQIELGENETLFIQSVTLFAQSLSLEQIEQVKKVAQWVN